MNDVILRQDAIKALDGTLEVTGIENAVVVTNYLNALRERIMCLPSAEAERKKGKWINCGSSEHWKCSCCGIRASYWFNEENSSGWYKDMSEWLSDFCPNCGAEMWGEEDDV